jgi:hypothetical protein
VTHRKAPAGEPLPAEARSNPPRTARADSDTAGRQPGYSYPPWYPPLPLTEHQLAGAEAAARHLLAHRLPPLFPLPVIRALWKRDRALASTLARIRGVSDG